MSATKLQPPIEGPAYDKTKPETRGPWLDFRRGGITATEIRDWPNGAKRRQIIIGKVTGEFEDLSHVKAINHGNLREPMIGAWVLAKFGIEPCESVYASAENPRHLASPDGISLDPFTRELVIGPGAVVAEIKTSKHDLTPGTLDAERVLISITPGSHFDLYDYYTQMQWQMHVMIADMTLFAYEQHDGKIDPETGTFSPVGPPQYAWVPRDQAMIDRLVNERAPAALAEIDKARGTSMPPASSLPAEHAILVQDLLDARDAEAIAKAKREKAWKALQAFYLSTDDEQRDDISIDAGFAKVTVSTTTKDVETVTVDEKAMLKRAPAVVAKYEALREKFTTKTVAPKSTQTLTITAPKNKGDQA